MHKHTHKRKRRKVNWRDANRPLSASESGIVRGITDHLANQESFAASYLRAEFLSKLNEESLVSAEQRRSAAIAKWLGTERKNTVTNSRLRGTDRSWNILPRVTWYSFLKVAQRIVSEVLGPLTNELVVGSFSGGASTSRRRTESHPAQKFVGQADVTEGALKFVDVIHHEVPLLRQLGIFYSLREVEGAQLFTVPKKSDIDRCACKEPDINMFLQKGVGRHIRRRLLHFGINLNDQSINRRYAYEGSVSDALATLDLSAASDSVTISCVEALLPHEWFLYLNDIRSHFVSVDGRNYRTEMFSSMGNGFTFELESLIFYALMRTTAYFEKISGVISVYGDDLIIPSGLFESASWVLRVFGFTLNPDKSFHTGPFRESCGGHYHLGVDVTPFYLKRPATRLTDVIRVANQIRLWAMSDPCRRFEMPEAWTMWSSLAALVPKDLWGGRDYSLDTQLVSPHAPGNRLVRISGNLELPQLGRYAFWHGSNWDRSCVGVESHAPISTSQRCRKRRAPLGALTLPDEFYEELVGVPTPG